MLTSVDIPDNISSLIILVSPDLLELLHIWYINIIILFFTSPVIFMVVVKSSWWRANGDNKNNDSKSLDVSLHD